LHTITDIQDQTNISALEITQR